MSGRSQRHLREIYGVDSAGESDVVAPPGFNPSTLLGTSVYGDFMRVSESVPAESGGLLTRWSGQRDDSRLGPGGSTLTDDWGFDLMPFASAPAVGAFGPDGTTAIRFSAGCAANGSIGRGGDASFNLVTPPISGGGVAPYPWPTGAAWTVGARFRITGIGQLALDSSPLQNFYLQMIDDPSTGVTAIDATRVSASFLSAYGGPINHGIQDAEWVTVVVVYDQSNVGPKVYINGTPLSGYLANYNAVFFRWWMGLAGTHSATVDMTAQFRGAVTLDAQGIADLTTWLEG